MGLLRRWLELYLLEGRLFNRIVLWKHYYQKEKELYKVKIDKFFSYLDTVTNKWYNSEDLFKAKPTDCLSQSINRGRDFLLSLRESNTYWNGNLESNVGLNAQYILLKRFMGIDYSKDEGVISYIIKSQNEDGSWSIYRGGRGHISYSILSYFALKVFGYSQDNSIMVKARGYIIRSGGITKANVETSFWLALYGQYPWEGLPPIPIQIMLAPLSFTFSIYNISYWCRTSLVPMSIIYNKKTVINTNICIDELYADDVDIKKITFDAKVSRFLSLENILLKMSKVAKILEKVPIEILDNISINKAKDWIITHQDDSGDWGGIYPATQYSIMALKVLGYDNSYLPISKGLEALERLKVEDNGNIIISPCTSPIWDTAWSLRVLNNISHSSGDPVINNAVEWLFNKQIFREGDWCIRNPNVLPGGWSFQFNNDFYPDVDDTAVVLMALLPNIRTSKQRDSIKVGINWLLSMQNDDGGWGGFERNVDKRIMNYLPINDIKNFLDQSTSDVTGRVLECLGKLGFSIDDPIVERAINFIKAEQESFGAWYGRWGVNYIYGTWSVVCGLISINENINSEYIQRAITWLKGCQNRDGGWGESCLSYDDISYAGKGESTPSQTAWALITLINTNEVKSESVNRGIAYLLSTQNKDGGWDEELYTGTGFERAFYLRYDYYSYYFPMFALTCYSSSIT